MKIGLLGCSSVAYRIRRRVLRRIRGVTLAAAADPDPEGRGRFSRASGIPVCKRARDLLVAAAEEAALRTVGTCGFS